jgi:hypothetical protein
VKVGTRPVVDIRLHETWGGFAKEADSTYKMAIDQSKFNASAVSGKWGYLPTSAINDTVDQNRFDLTMRMRGDATIYYTAADTLNDKCFGTDTVNAYIIPGRMPLDIDKYAEEENKLYLHWDTTGVPAIAYIDSVRVMSIKWDGYAIVNQYARRAMVTKDDTLYDVRTDNDTLEFFYVQGSRYIEEAKQRFYSRTSDTVGYYKQWLRGKSSTTTSNNMISYPFDMSSKGLLTTKKFGEYFGKDASGKFVIESVEQFVSATQTWNTSIYSSSGWLPPDFTLSVGDMYNVILKEGMSDMSFLLYGKLPAPFTYNLLKQPAGKIADNNYALVPLSFISDTRLRTIGNTIPNITSIGYYDFNKQQWTYEVYSAGTGWTGLQNNYRLMLWQPLTVTLNNGVSWSK